MAFDLNYLNPFSTKKNFYTDALSLIGINNTSDHVEAYKMSSSEKVNAEVSALNSNNNTVSAIRRNFEKHVIRTALNIQSYTSNTDFNNEFEKNLRDWSKKGNCELTGRFYRGSAERWLISEVEVLSGGFILRHHFDVKFKYGYKFEIIPLSAIDRSKHDFTNMLFNGIQLNKNGEITHIHIYTNHEKQQSRPIPYSELTLNVKIWVDSTQYSGISPIAPVLASLDLLHQYTMEEMKGAKTRASNNIIIRTHFYNEMKKIALANGKTNLTAEMLKTIFEKFKIDQNGDVVGAKYIPVEDEVTELGKSTQSVYDPLTQNINRNMSVGVGLSPMSTVGEMPSSYNSTLYFSQQEEGTYDIAKEDFVENAWREVIETKLMNGMMLVGKLKTADPIKYWTEPEQYRELMFIRASSDHIDPSKVQKAISEGLYNKSKNIIDVLASDGKDWKEHIVKEIEYEKYRKEQFEKAGLIYQQSNIDPQILVPTQQEVETDV
jgi:hypothetical protein